MAPPLSPIIPPGVPGNNDPTAEIYAPVSNVQASTVMTSTDLKNNFLYGIPLTSPLTGQQFPEDSMRFSLDAGTEWLERELGISIRARFWYQERHDYVSSDYFNFCLIRLNHYPIVKLTDFLVIYPDTGQTTTFPLSWLQTDMEGLNGVIQMVPGVGSAAAYVIGMGNSLLPMIFKTADFIPDLFKISYWSGFPNNKVPSEILSVIGKKAAIDVLTQVSNALLGAGVLSQSLSIDSMSQSVTKLAFIYEKQIQLYRQQIKEEVSTLRSFYGGLRMTVA